MTWLVVNRETGIVVSRWRNEQDAWADKDARDARWVSVQPLHESKLVVQPAESAA